MHIVQNIKLSPQCNKSVNANKQGSRQWLLARRWKNKSKQFLKSMYRFLMRYTVSLNKQFVMKCFNYLQFHANVQLDTIILCDIIQPSMPNNKQSKTRAWCKTTVTALFYITGYNSFATSSQITIIIFRQ